MELEDLCTEGAIAFAGYGCFGIEESGFIYPRDVQHESLGRCVLIISLNL
jgi:hypothetical protein